jgi:hypothetical protein
VSKDSCTSRCFLVGLGCRCVFLFCQAPETLSVPQHLGWSPFQMYRFYELLVAFTNLVQRQLLLDSFLRTSCRNADLNIPPIKQKVFVLFQTLALRLHTRGPGPSVTRHLRFSSDSQTKPKALAQLQGYLTVRSVVRRRTGS